jgi:hypothetical protein
MEKYAGLQWVDGRGSFSDDNYLNLNPFLAGHSAGFAFHLAGLLTPALELT